MELPPLQEDDVLFLEKEIDRMEEALPSLRSFILPGGNTVVSYAHIARCVCRRCERVVTHLGEESTIDLRILVYINRLSDYLFVLSRFFGQSFNVAETPWFPRM